MLFGCKSVENFRKNHFPAITHQKIPRTRGYKPTHDQNAPNLIFTLPPKSSKGDENMKNVVFFEKNIKNFSLSKNLKGSKWPGKCLKLYLGHSKSLAKHSWNLGEVVTYSTLVVVVRCVEGKFRTHCDGLLSGT